MLIRAGYEIAFDRPQPTPMLMLSVHPSRAADLRTPGHITYTPSVPATTYQDRFGNICTRTVALCRCMNIPARYCTGHLGDIGVPPADAPMDFGARFDAYLDGPGGGRWYSFDARHNTPRIGRALVARGRDATDVAPTASFGPHALAGFRVVTSRLPA